MKFNTVVCGGTFDHFHKGHESFLRYVFSVGEKFIVGVTSDEYVKKFKMKNSKLKIIEDFKERKKTVLEFFKKQEVLDRVKILEINDLFGPTLSKSMQIDAIIVSEDTKNGADIISRKRKELGLKDLKILIAPSIKAEDGKLISSQRVRNGEINREGKSYVNPLWLKKILFLPESLRKELGKPLGDLINDLGQEAFDDSRLVITVGDVTTKKFNELNLPHQISVVDFKVLRKKEFDSVKELGFSGEEKVVKVKNLAGTISPSLFKLGFSTEDLSDKNKKAIVLVDGEEDLAVLPLVLVSPLNAVIYYGQPGEGIVKIEISEQIKKMVYGLVNKFEMLK